MVVKREEQTGMEMARNCPENTVVDDGGDGMKGGGIVGPRRGDRQADARKDVE